MIHKISFSNYKLFKNWQTLELKPITILIGKNNAGKSSIAKLPVLVAGSLSGTFQQPIKLNYKGVHLESLNKNLIYNKKITRKLELKIENTHSKEILAVNLIVDLKDKPEITEWTYNGEPISNLKKGKWNGFTNTQVQFKTLKLNMDYIEAFRARPQQTYTYSYDADKLNSIGINGENVYPILIQAYEEDDNNNGLIKKISDWYQHTFEGWKLSVKNIDIATSTFQFVLENDNIDGVNLVNVGQGIHQTLPLITRSYMLDEEPVLIIIEEPETHLHPAAHGDLAERFAYSHLEDSNKNYLIETHSQNFILRMRRLVAQKQLKKEDLAIYYIDFDETTSESTLKKINVDDYGGVDYWPEGIFSESLKETIAIRNAQLNYLKK